MSHDSVLDFEFLRIFKKIGTKNSIILDTKGSKTTIKQLKCSKFLVLRETVKKEFYSMDLVDLQSYITASPKEVGENGSKL